MTPEIQIRSFSTDQYHLDKILYSNFYCLKGVKDKEKQPIVVDIGAHAGYFTFLALSLGAKRVYSVEPFFENYRMFVKNLFGTLSLGVVIPYQLGIYTEQTFLSLEYPSVSDKGMFDFADIKINPSSNKVFVAPTLTLDTFLKDIVKEPVDILKINVGYSETSMLQYSTHGIVNVTSVCGETILDEQGQNHFKGIMFSKGFLDSRFSSVEGEENKTLFHFSRTKLEDTFAFK